MKKQVVFLVICMLFMVTVPVAALHEEVSAENSVQESSPEKVKAVFMIHKFDGDTEKIVGYLSVEQAELFRSKDVDADAIEEMLPDDVKSCVEKAINEAYQEISTMTVKDVRNPLVSMLSKRLGVEEDASLGELAEMLGNSGAVYVNAVCKVIGIGLLLLFPPFIPVTPLLFATFSVVTTEGTMGEWTHGAVLVFCMPFVGVSVYLLPQPMFVFTGFAGLVVALGS